MTIPHKLFQSAKIYLIVDIFFGILASTRQSIDFHGSMTLVGSIEGDLMLSFQ